MHMAAGPQACLQGSGRGQVHGQGHGRRGFQKKKRSFWGLESVETQREFRRLLRFGFGSRRGSGPRVKGAGNSRVLCKVPGTSWPSLGVAVLQCWYIPDNTRNGKNNANIWSLT